MTGRPELPEVEAAVRRLDAFFTVTSFVKFQIGVFTVVSKPAYNCSGGFPVVAGDQHRNFVWCQGILSYIEDQSGFGRWRWTEKGTCRPLVGAEKEEIVVALFLVGDCIGCGEGQALADQGVEERLKLFSVTFLAKDCQLVFGAEEL